MTEQYDNTNRIVLFNNDKEGNASRPDRTGKMELGTDTVGSILEQAFGTDVATKVMAGATYIGNPSLRVSVWDKGTVMSGQVQPPFKKQEQPKDDIPF